MRHSSKDRLYGFVGCKENTCKNNEKEQNNKFKVGIYRKNGVSDRCGHPYQ